MYLFSGDTASKPVWDMLSKLLIALPESSGKNMPFDPKAEEKNWIKYLQPLYKPAKVNSQEDIHQSFLETLVKPESSRISGPSLANLKLPKYLNAYSDLSFGVPVYQTPTPALEISPVPLSISSIPSLTPTSPPPPTSYELPSNSLSVPESSSTQPSLPSEKPDQDRIVCKETPSSFGMIDEEECEAIPEDMLNMMNTMNEGMKFTGSNMAVGVDDPLRDTTTKTEGNEKNSNALAQASATEVSSLSTDATGDRINLPKENINAASGMRQQSVNNTTTYPDFKMIDQDVSSTNSLFREEQLLNKNTSLPPVVLEKNKKTTANIKTTVTPATTMMESFNSFNVTPISVDQIPDQKEIDKSSNVFPQDNIQKDIENSQTIPIKTFAIQNSSNELTYHNAMDTSYPTPKYFGLEYLLEKKKNEMARNKELEIWAQNKKYRSNYPRPEPFRLRNGTYIDVSQLSVSPKPKNVALKISMLPNNQRKQLMRISGPYETDGTKFDMPLFTGSQKMALSEEEETIRLRQKYREEQISQATNRYPSKYLTPVNRNYDRPPPVISSNIQNLERPLIHVEMPSKSAQRFIKITSNLPQQKKGNEFGQSHYFDSSRVFPKVKTLSIKLPINVSLATVLKNIYDHMYEYYFHKRPQFIDKSDSYAAKELIRGLVVKDIANISSFVTSSIPNKINQHVTPVINATEIQRNDHRQVYPISKAQDPQENAVSRFRMAFPILKQAHNLKKPYFQQILPPTLQRPYHPRDKYTSFVPIYNNFHFIDNIPLIMEKSANPYLANYLTIWNRWKVLNTKNEANFNRQYKIDPLGAYQAYIRKKKTLIIELQRLKQRLPILKRLIDAGSRLKSGANKFLVPKLQEIDFKTSPNIKARVFHHVRNQNRKALGVLLHDTNTAEDEKSVVANRQPRQQKQNAYNQLFIQHQRQHEVELRKNQKFVDQWNPQNFQNKFPSTAGKLRIISISNSIGKRKDSLPRKMAIKMPLERNSYPKVKSALTYAGQPIHHPILRNHEIESSPVKIPILSDRKVMASIKKEVQGPSLLVELESIARDQSKQNTISKSNNNLPMPSKIQRGSTKTKIASPKKSTSTLSDIHQAISEAPNSVNYFLINTAGVADNKPMVIQSIEDYEKDVAKEAIKNSKAKVDGHSLLATKKGVYRKPNIKDETNDIANARYDKLEKKYPVFHSMALNAKHTVPENTGSITTYKNKFNHNLITPSLLKNIPPKKEMQSTTKKNNTGKLKLGLIASIIPVISELHSYNGHSVYKGSKYTINEEIKTLEKENLPLSRSNDTKNDWKNWDKRKKVPSWVGNDIVSRHTIPKRLGSLDIYKRRHHHLKHRLKLMKRMISESDLGNQTINITKKVDREKYSKDKNNLKSTVYKRIENSSKTILNLRLEKRYLKQTKDFKKRVRKKEHRSFKVAGVDYDKGYSYQNSSKDNVNATVNLKSARSIKSKKRLPLHTL